MCVPLPRIDCCVPLLPPFPIALTAPRDELTLQCPHPQGQAQAVRLRGQHGSGYPLHGTGESHILFDRESSLSPLFSLYSTSILPLLSIPHHDHPYHYYHQHYHHPSYRPPSHPPSILPSRSLRRWIASKPCWPTRAGNGGAATRHQTGYEHVLSLLSLHTVIAVIVVITSSLLSHHRSRHCQCVILVAAVAATASTPSQATRS